MIHEKSSHPKDGEEKFLIKKKTPPLDMFEKIPRYEEIGCIDLTETCKMSGVAFTYLHTFDDDVAKLPLRRWFLLEGFQTEKQTTVNMGVSKNTGTPKWMVYNGKPYENG